MHKASMLHFLHLLVALWTAAPGYAQILTDNSDLIETKKLVVMINGTAEDKERQGTGIIFAAIGEWTYILTPQHVAFYMGKPMVALKVRVWEQPSKTFAAEILPYANIKNDVAVLRARLPKTTYPFKRLADPKNLKMSSPVWAIGHPLNQQDWVTIFQAGAISAVGVGKMTFQSSLIEPGFSGGPLIDANKLIVGMVLSDSATNTHADALPIDRAVEILQKEFKLPVDLTVAPLGPTTISGASNPSGPGCSNASADSLALAVRGKLLDRTTTILECAPESALDPKVVAAFSDLFDATKFTVSKRFLDGLSDAGTFPVGSVCDFALKAAETGGLDGTLWLVKHVPAGTLGKCAAFVEIVTLAGPIRIFPLPEDVWAMRREGLTGTGDDSPLFRKAYRLFLESLDSKSYSSDAEQKTEALAPLTFDEFDRSKAEVENEYREWVVAKDQDARARPTPTWVKDMRLQLLPSLPHVMAIARQYCPDAIPYCAGKPKSEDLIRREQLKWK